MKNKNRIFRIASLLLVLCFISTVMISGTFAKYTSEYVGQDTALVAKWDVVVTDGDVTLTDDGVANLDLFSHLYDVNIISTAGDDKIIAPGVSGDFTLSVTNNSDVAAEVTFEFKVDDETGVVVPMQFSLDNFAEEGDIYTDLGDLADELEIATIAAASLLTEDPPEAVTKIVYWRWPFEVGEDEEAIEGNDAADTVLGKASADSTEGRTEYILTVTATATQLEPDKTPPPETP